MTYDVPGVMRGPGWSRKRHNLLVPLKMLNNMSIFSQDRLLYIYLAISPFIYWQHQILEFIGPAKCDLIYTITVLSS